MWTELDERFGQSNGARLYQVQKDICSTTQGNLDVAGYYTKLKKLWDELALILNLPKCTCGAIQEMMKQDQNQKLVQFLMGLNSDYNTIRGNILVMRPLPSVSTAYGMIIHEEKQREIQGNTQFMPEHASLNANSQASYKGKYDDKRNLTCEHCKKRGHTANKCYRIVGFPKDFRFTKSKRVAAGALSGGECEVDDSKMERQINPELCSQFVKFLSSFQGDKTHYHDSFHSTNGWYAPIFL
ncbi:unnamed protein product [Cuscuta campestris]|uniref:Uncharacterized protein n=1 Tax=Cuscuta campestris TaxID=132261 RepID=A0A484M0A6_9ASTE|nr:unnamed protein product [Cuscuta campestris]